MYGLVNNGIRTFILDSHGEATWQAICDKAGVTDEEFENMASYDDGQTYALVGAVSETLSLPAETVLEVFGEYWVGFSKQTSVGKLVDQGSETLIDRIRGLDEMHEMVKTTMPHLNPPGFDFEERPDGNHRLHYYSSREGLAPMVVGLLRGMAQDSGVSVRINQLEYRGKDSDHDVFSVRIESAEASSAA
ncbi:heme NO-binding domain-containing protein [Pacificoceanicola onchidii]|uniref:heme NO-binding domain-containing protein n=1 Tax=Pacificoceanicola onchidii TaxID=2562685 RepID=UPI0010A68E12|nr:heme NO-binding domain-containing protein [Pacificoceanicola onchidii]